MKGRLAAVGLVPVLLGACAINPVTHRPELVLMSAAKERELGAEQARQIEQAIGFAGSPELAAHVAEVGARVAAESPRTDVRYTFHIVDLPEPNAFALPSGDVYVSRGLLALLNSDAELAGVLGHEVGHVAARHSVQRVTRAAPLAVVTGLASGVTGIASPLLGDLVGGVGGAATGLVVAAYSRDQERQADELGQRFEAAAGWDPTALAQALDTLQRAEALEPGGARRPSFFDSHPATPERVTRAEAHARSLSSAAPPADPAARAEFIARLDGLVIGVPAAEGQVAPPWFLHPDLDLAVRFPDEWQIANGRREVSASPAEGGALIVLDAVAEGDDPQLNVRAMEREIGATLPGPFEPLTINGFPAVQTEAAARTTHGPVALHLTWIAKGGTVYRVTGLAPLDRAESAAATAQRVAGSIRPLTAAERKQIHETRLRIVPALAGETPAAIAERTGSAWDAQMIAVANGVASDAPFAAGTPVKIAVSEPYGGGRRVAGPGPIGWNGTTAGDPSGAERGGRE